MTTKASPRVDFYIFGDTHPNATINMACKIVEKAYAHQQIIFILTPNSDVSATLDKALWSFQEASFIPHAIQTSQHASDESLQVIIGNDATHLSSLKNKEILLNLTQEIDLPIFQSFKRIIEIVNESSGEIEKTKSRQKYKTYRDNQFVLHSHHVKSQI